MRVAFYFDQDEGYGDSLMGVDLAVASSIVDAVPTQRRHVTLSAGTIGQHRFVTDRHALDNVVEGLLGRTVPAWTTIGQDELVTVLTTVDVAVFVVDGLVAPDARRMHRTLTGSPGYLGAIEVLSGEQVVWAVYALPERYRVVGDELRLFYRDGEYRAGVERDELPMDVFRESGLFARVTWEDIGVRDTLFDPYRTPEHARTAADVEAMVSTQMAGVTNEIFLRLGRLDPRLVRYLHGAFTSFERLDTGDALAHAALSCRRLIENLANALYPPRDGPDDDGSLGKARYRSRLRAYVADQLDSRSQRHVVLAALDDVVNRITKLDAVANSGLHSDIDTSEARRLLVGLTTLVYDLLTLTDPPLTAPDAPYEEYARTVMRDLLGVGDDPDRPGHRGSGPPVST